METSFSAKVWNWYADDEYEKLLSFLQLCHGLAEKGTDLFMAQWCWSKINLSHFLLGSSPPLNQTLGQPVDGIARSHRIL